MKVLRAYPAYGRQYADPGQALEAFHAGKDFSASRQGGPYFSIRDFQPGKPLEDFDGIVVENWFLLAHPQPDTTSMEIEIEIHDRGLQ